MQNENAQEEKGLIGIFNKILRHADYIAKEDDPDYTPIPDLTSQQLSAVIWTLNMVIAPSDMVWSQLDAMNEVRANWVKFKQTHRAEDPTFDPETASEDLLQALFMDFVGQEAQGTLELLKNPDKVMDSMLSEVFQALSDEEPPTYLSRN